MKLPPRKELHPRSLRGFDNASGWNECLDEIARLNETQTGPEPGQVWFVQLGKQGKALTFKVLQVTDMTVVLEDVLPHVLGLPPTQERYVRSKVTFLERAHGYES